MPSYLVLLPVGLAKPVWSPRLLVVSYTTFSPSPRAWAGAGSLFSVALSVGSPRLDVIQHRALWSSDFPRLEAFQPRPPDLLGHASMIPLSLRSVKNGARFGEGASESCRDEAFGKNLLFRQRVRASECFAPIASRRLSRHLKTLDMNLTRLSNCDIL